MAFNNVGQFFLAPGASTRVHIARGGVVAGPEWGGHDMGAQWIMAHPNLGGATALVVRDHTKERKPLHNLSDPTAWVYSVTVTNVANGRIGFSLQGGGNV